MKVLLFAGTTEGRIAAKALIDEGAQLTVCTATDYGAQLIPEGCRVISGRLDADEMYELMAGEGFDKVVDATHPYALEVTENIRNACERLGLLYERIERGESETIEDERVIYFDGLDEAVAFLKERKGNMLSTIGIKGLPQLTEIEDYECRVFARIIPEPENLAQAVSLGFRGKHIICMQGPFGTELNRALMKELDISFLLTKDSGKEGGFDEKIKAALALNVTCLVIKRPAVGSGERKTAGMTTGTCAALAAKAAAYMAVTGREPGEVSMMLPMGQKAKAQPEDLSFFENGAGCGVRKDASGDIDVTVGLTVCAFVTLTPGDDIRIDGGDGVGTVTKPGLALAVGEKAINPGPRAMIEAAVREVFESLGYEGGALVVISVPGGSEAAKKTFNEKLGITGGISILGTTGVVRPMSTAAFVEAMEAHMNVVRAAGKDILLTPGSIGEELSAGALQISKDRIVQCSNFVGKALDLACIKGFETVILAGSLGKLVKVAAGIMDTHSKTADGRMEVMGVYAAMAGAGRETVKRIMDCISTDAALDILRQEGLFDEVMKALTDAVLKRCRDRCKNEVMLSVVIFSGSGDIIGRAGDI